MSDTVLQRKKICIIAEGSYPYITGGVSSWIQDIISGLKNYDFILLAISATEDNELKYTLPKNVIAVEDRILTAEEKSGSKKIDSEFFKEIKTFHKKIMNDKDFTSLESIVHHMHEHKYSYQKMLQHKTSWDQQNCCEQSTINCD